jgi:hypothetical protein
MLIKVYLGGLYPNAPFYTNSTDGFSKLLSRSGFQVVEDPIEADIFISIDAHIDDLAHFSHSENIHSKFLIRNEPRIVCPLNYDESFVSRYGTVIDVGRFNESAHASFYWPQFWPINLTINYDDRLDQIAIISGNKLSLIPGELYSLRRKCILRIKEIAHFGTTWDSKNTVRMKMLIIAMRLNLRFRILPSLGSIKYWFKNYDKWLGAPYEKRACLSSYKYSLVIENSADYLSEKVFDAFFSFTLPIYVGPDVSNYGIPSDLVIQCEPNLESIKEGVEKAFQTDYLSWRNKVKNWLDLPETRANWEGYEVCGRIISEVKQRAQITI